MDTWNEEKKEHYEAKYIKEILEEGVGEDIVGRCGGRFERDGNQEFVRGRHRIETYGHNSEAALHGI